MPSLGSRRKVGRELKAYGRARVVIIIIIMTGRGRAKSLKVTNLSPESCNNNNVGQGTYCIITTFSI